jgi:PAS domain S-box-containing protein
MVIAIEHAGADRGLLILLRGEELQIEAEATTGSDRVEVALREAAVRPSELPESVLHYVIRTRQSVILDDAASPTLFSTDPYVQRRRPRSVLCLPLVKQAKLMGVIYLENNLTPRVFTPDRLAVLELLTSQAAISLDNARVYTELARLNADLTQENSDRRKAEEALRASENQIRQLNASLGKRVVERTTELARSEEKFRALFEGTSQAVVLLDENGILEANPSWLKLLGYSSLDEVVGKTPTELSAPIQAGGQRAEVLARTHIDRALANGSERFEWVMLRCDETALPLEIFLTRIQLGGRQLIQAVCNDITQRKQAEAELVRTLARGKELGQLRSKFVSMVSHEFRTPLGIIQSSAEILEDYLDRLDPAERQDHLRSIRKNTCRMARIMEEVLLIGSFDAGKMEFKPAALDLRTFVRGLVDEVLAATSRQCPIELSVSELPAEIQADERLLRHIFTNLLTNAVKYSDAGRAVRFEIGRVGAEVVCAIRDQGIGIPEADRQWLFSAFHRGHNVEDRPGTGLGLVIVKRCVDLQGGKINVESEVGEGTTVTISWPIVWPSPAGATAGTST